MSRSGVLRRRLAGAGLALVVCTGLTGCAWQGYAVSRGVRLVTGVRTRVHTIAPIRTPLRRYRVIEAHWLRNLLPGRVPPPLERYLNDALADELGRVASAPAVVRVDPDLPADLVRTPRRLTAGS